MMRLIIIIFLLTTAGMLIISCRGTRKIQQAIAKKDTVAAQPVVDAHADSVKMMQDSYYLLLGNRIEFETFSAKINADYQGSDGKNNNVNAFVRMKRDSIIWISINAMLGIEAMRVLVDKDSVKILNKLDKEYQVRSLEYLQEVASLPLDLRSVQELIIGNPLFLDTNFISYSLVGDLITLLCEGKWFRNQLTMSNNDHLILHSKLDDLDNQHNRTCFLSYADYENKRGKPFSTSRTVSVTEKTKLDIKLNFKQYEFNEKLSFPFSVPKNYKRK